MRIRLSRHKGAIGGALTLVVLGALLLTPAGAHVSDNIQHIWNQHLQDLAKQDFYTKNQTDKKFLGKDKTAKDSAKLQGRRADSFADRGAPVTLYQNGTWNTNPDVTLDQGSVGVSTNVTTIASETGTNGEMWSQLHLVGPLSMGADPYALQHVSLCFAVGDAQDLVDEIRLIDQGKDAPDVHTDATDRANTSKACPTIQPPAPIKFLSSPMLQVRQKVDQAADTLSIYSVHATWVMAPPD